MSNKFIEIKPGLSIKKEDIESIQILSEDDIQDNGSRIVMESGATYDSVFPYLTMLKLLEFQASVEAKAQEDSNKREFFAG